MHLGFRAFSALAMAAVSPPLAQAQLHLSGRTTGFFDDLGEPNTTIVNAADHSSASFATGVPIPGSTQSKIMFENATFSNVASGDPIQTGLFTITNGMTQIGSGAPTAQFNLGLELTSPAGETVVLNNIKFHIDHTPNLPGSIPDSFSVSFDQPAPVKLQNTLVQFHVMVTPLDFLVPENATVEKGDITVSFSPIFTPVPEPATYALAGSVLLLAAVGYRRLRPGRLRPAIPAIA